ncbi:MAG TPA: WD40 repeat domain-containing protein [Alloacidobacterium sp.]|nr:WD40 repeat domain-containing protein [Alloacidobacterium sp.]
MQRFFALIALFVLSIPVGISIAGCGGSNPKDFCTKNGHGYGERVTDLDHISLGPASTGISLSYGQTGQLNQPQGFNCNGGTVSVAHWIYGTTNLNVADINPSTGAICAGTWNRHSASGIPDFTICTPPAAPAVAQVTASASAVTSNPVNVYIHPPITAVTIGNQTACVSQNQTLPAPLTQSTKVFGPDGVAIDPAYIGTITYTPVNSTIVTINNTSDANSTSPVNGLATAHMPGSTAINATLSGTTSAAGYFYTCPPKSIGLTLNGSTGIPTPVTVSAGSPQNMIATIPDTTGAAISGLSLDYTSTQPKQIAVSSTGTVTATFPTTTTVTAICQPGTCNPAANVGVIGQFGTGLPVVSNPVIVNTPGRSSSKLWLASSQSSYFTPVDLTSSGAPVPIKLPYIPNSMVIDQNGTNLYFGSYHELMVVNAANNTLSKEDPNVPGVVLAVSPDNATAVINDQVNQIIYLYNESKGSFTSRGGLATRAQWSPDGKNLYIVGPNNFYVYNASTGWSTYTNSNGGNNVCTASQLNNNNGAPYDPFCSPDLTVAIPSIGPFITGSNTTANGFCPVTPVDTTNPDYYPLAATIAAATDHVTATNDGNHILGATASPAQIADISVKIPTGSCPASGQGIKLQQGTDYAVNTTALTDVVPSEITGVISSPDATISFITYNASGASGLLPAYKPSTSFGTAGTLTNVQLSSGALAPISGAFSPDDSTFFVGTSGDNLLHLVDVQSLTDTKTINPRLPACVKNPANGAPTCDPSANVPVQFIAVQPRATT